MDCVAPLRRGVRRNPSVTSRCGSPLLLLTCALLMTPSHSEGCLAREGSRYVLRGRANRNTGRAAAAARASTAMLVGGRDAAVAIAVEGGARRDPDFDGRGARLQAGSEGGAPQRPQAPHPEEQFGDAEQQRWPMVGALASSRPRALVPSCPLVSCSRLPCGAVDAVHRTFSSLTSLRTTLVFPPPPPPHHHLTRAAVSLGRCQ